MDIKIRVNEGNSIKGGLNEVGVIGAIARYIQRSEVSSSSIPREHVKGQNNVSI